MSSSIRRPTRSRRSRTAWLARGIAVAAVVTLTIGGCQDHAAPQVEPSEGAAATASSATPQVQQRDFQLRYQLDAQTVSSEVVRLSAPTGTGFIDVGAVDTTVRVGQVIAQLQVDEAYASELGATAEANRIDAGRLRQLSDGEGPVEAPVTGVLREDPPYLLVEAAGVDVVANLSGVQTLRLGAVALTGQATVETVLGTRTVDCDYLWIEQVVDEEQIASAIHCRLPRTVETAAQLRSTLVVESEQIDDALVVPNASIGVADDGYFVVLQDGNGERTVPVDVGPSDGVVRVITTPLPVGAALGAVEPAP